MSGPPSTATPARDTRPACRALRAPAGAARRGARLGHLPSGSPRRDFDAHLGLLGDSWPAAVLRPPDRPGRGARCGRRPPARSPATRRTTAQPAARSTACPVTFVDVGAVRDPDDVTRPARPARARRAAAQLRAVDPGSGRCSPPPRTAPTWWSRALRRRRERAAAAGGAARAGLPPRRAGVHLHPAGRAGPGSPTSPPRSWPSSAARAGPVVGGTRCAWTRRADNSAAAAPTGCSDWSTTTRPPRRARPGRAVLHRLGLRPAAHLRVRGGSSAPAVGLGATPGCAARRCCGWR